MFQLRERRFNENNIYKKKKNQIKLKTVQVFHKFKSLNVFFANEE